MRQQIHATARVLAGDTTEFCDTVGEFPHVAIGAANTDGKTRWHAETAILPVAASPLPDDFNAQSKTDSVQTLMGVTIPRWRQRRDRFRVMTMRPQLRTQPPTSPPPRWNVLESADHRAERDGRITQMMLRAQKHAVKAELRHPEAERIACLFGMLERLRHEHAQAAHIPELGDHLADAVRDLETLIVRLILRRSASSPI